MKLIFSRKGFDSSSGRVPSPILPDGSILHLPIPARNGNSTIRYQDLSAGDGNVGALVHDLTGGRITGGERAHVDPDLNPRSLPRKPGWRPLFGQAGAAQGHLLKQGIRPGDVFLFFGWFQQTRYANGRLVYDRGAPGIHAIFGWLQIARAITAPEYGRAPQWAAYHPHFQRKEPYANDTVYVSAKHLRLPGVGATSLPGAGVFSRFSSKLQLTKDQCNRSIWQLPGWCYPRNGSVPFTYHGKGDRWRREGEKVTVQTVGRGQEFVMDTAVYPEAIPWLQELLQLHTVP